VWFVLRGIFTKAIDLVLTLEGNSALITMGLFKERLKTLAIFVVATIYREILRYAALAELWFWRVAYTMNSVENYFKIFYIGQIVQWGIFERFTFKNPDIVLGPDDFEEIRLMGGNMAKDGIERNMWGFGSSNTISKVGKWQIDPVKLALVKPHGQQDGDCTLETISGQTIPGSGKLTVMIATQPAKAVIPVTVEEEKTGTETRGENWLITYEDGGGWGVYAGGAIFAVWEGDIRDYLGMVTAPGYNPWYVTIKGSELYTKDSLVENNYDHNIWNLANDEVAYCFYFDVRATGGETEQDALDTFYAIYGTNWVEDMQNQPVWQETLLFSLEIIS